MAFDFPENVDFFGVHWKAKYEQAVRDGQESKMKLGIANSVLDLARAQRDQAKLDAAAMERDLKEELKTVKLDLEDADGHLDQLEAEIEDLKAEIEDLTSPEVEDDESLSGDDNMASETSDESEVSPSYEDSPSQAIVVPEEPVTMPPMNAETVAGLEAKIENLRRQLKIKESELEGNAQYIKRTEDQATEFEKKYEDEEKVSADLRAQLDKAKLEIKAREEDIKGENGLEDLLFKAQNTIDEELGPELKQQIQLNKNLKEDLEAAKGLVEFYKKEAAAVAQTSSELIKKDKKIEKQVENREVAIEQLNEQLGDAAHFEDDLYEHQKLLEDTVTEMNKSVEDGPKFNPHPEAYVAPDTVTPVSQTLSEQLAGHFSTSGQSSSLEEFDSDSASDHTAEVEDPANATGGIDAEKEEIAEDQRILDQKLRQVDLVEIEIKVPVEEVTVVPAGPAPVPIPSGSQPSPYIQTPVPSVPAAPEIIIKEVDRVVFNGKDVHSWSHIERDFLVLVLAFFNYFTGMLWPSFIQEVRGVAPISDHPIPVPDPEDDKQPEAGDLPESGALPQAMVNSAIATSTPDSSAATNAAPLGSDLTDTQGGSGPTVTDDFAALLTPLPASPDRRESIALAPPASPPRRPASSSNNDNTCTNPNSRISPTGDGNGDQSGPPGPPKGDGNGSSPPNPPNGDGNGGPPSPPGPPNGDGFGDSPAETPGFWDIFAPRPLPSIKWTLGGMFLHLVVYYCVYLTIDTYFERNLWLAANDATRQWLHSIMGVRYTNGILRKIISDTWATRIDRSLLYAVTKVGIMELKTFPRFRFQLFLLRWNGVSGVLT